jgi:YHS domain-containing protein
MNRHAGSFAWPMRIDALRRRLFPALAVVLVMIAIPAATARAHDQHGSAAATEEAGDKVVAVESNMVCMINDRSMANEQIPVPIEGRTYYGCCSMCKERLEKSEESRSAIDPVSGKKVDKARAFIGALPGAAVLYFEDEANFHKYNAGARAAEPNN